MRNLAQTKFGMADAEADRVGQRHPHPTLSHRGRGFSPFPTTGGQAYTTSYDYDRQGNQTTITNPDSSIVKYNYNSAGLLESIQDIVTNFDYSPTGQLTTIAYPNGTTTKNTYDPNKLYRLISKVTSTPTSQIQNLSYTYDVIGNITQTVDASNTNTSKTANYVYDDLYRLIEARITNVAPGQKEYTETFTYNPIGNMLTNTSGTYLYGGENYANPHAVTAVTVPSGVEGRSITFSYDNNGNQLTKGSDLINTWDYNNRLTQVITKSSTNSYVYDPSGQRIVSTNAPLVIVNVSTSGSASRSEVSKSPDTSISPTKTPELITTTPTLVSETPKPTKTETSKPRPRPPVIVEPEEVKGSWR